MYYIGEIRGFIYYLDFNSHYPNVGRMDLPVGKARYYSFEDFTPNDKFNLRDKSLDK